MVMVTQDNTGEKGKRMIMKDTAGNIKYFELCPKSHGKSFEQRRETCSHLHFRKITFKKKKKERERAKKNHSTVWKINQQ